MVAVGSQDVIAAKCCPGHSMAAQEERRRTRLGVGERLQSTSQNLKKYFKYKVKIASINVIFQSSKHKWFISN